MGATVMGVSVGALVMCVSMGVIVMGAFLWVR